MYIEELKEGEVESGEEQLGGDLYRRAVVAHDAKRVLVGAGARALFYPTLLYNVVRNKIQTEFRWWDRVDEFVLLGAVPFPTDVPRLKSLGVGGVVTLNEPYETLVPTSLYYDYNIDHLVIPTRDYLFAPSYGDISQAVDFIHGNASCGKTTYVHCKAGRGRSTTIVLCYLVRYKNMTPESAYNYVQSIRPRVLLASAQWQALQDYYHTVKEAATNSCVKKSVMEILECPAEVDVPAFDTVTEPATDVCVKNSVMEILSCPAEVDVPAAFDDGSVVLVTESDLDGYDECHNSSGATGNKNMLTELKLACKVQFASQAAVSRLSCLWLRSHNDQKVSSWKKLGGSSVTNNNNNNNNNNNDNKQLESIGSGIHVY